MVKMLWLISQTYKGYLSHLDTFDAAVVCAYDQESARGMHPGGGKIGDNRGYDWPTDPKLITVKYIGLADEPVEIGVVLASFNSGG